MYTWLQTLHLTSADDITVVTFWTEAIFVCECC